MKIKQKPKLPSTPTQLNVNELFILMGCLNVGMKIAGKDTELTRLARKLERALDHLPGGKSGAIAYVGAELGLLPRDPAQ